MITHVLLMNKVKVCTLCYCNDYKYITNIVAFTVAIAT